MWDWFRAPKNMVGNALSGGDGMESRNVSLTRGPHEDGEKPRMVWVRRHLKAPLSWGRDTFH